MMVSASSHPDEDVIWFPRCLNTCVKNLQQLSLAWLDWGTALPGGFHHSELGWCADVPRGFMERLETELCWTSSANPRNYLETHCVKEFLLFPGCLLKTTIQVFNLREQEREEGGRRGAPPVCPHISSPKFSCVMESQQTALAQCPWTGCSGRDRVTPPQWQQRRCKSSSVPSSGVKSYTDLENLCDQLKGGKDFSACSFIANWRGNWICLWMGKRNLVKFPRRTLFPLLLQVT